MGLAPFFCFRILEKRPTLDTELNQLLGPAIVDLGLELLGIEFSQSGGGSLLRIYIDHPDRGVGIEDCERASREISALLDVNDPVAGRYTLEVSSPGLERPLFTMAHFERFIGEQAKIGVNLPIDGRRRFQGPIVAVEGDRITLDQDGTPVTIAHANVAKARLVPDYVALGLAPAPREGGKKPASRAKKS